MARQRIKRNVYVRKVAMTETVGSKLNALRKRSRMSLRQIAEATGKAGVSSVQRYFDEQFDQPLRSSMVLDLGEAMVGRGEPPIKYEELFALSDYQQLTELATSTKLAQAFDATAENKLAQTAAGLESAARKFNAQPVQSMAPPTLRGQPRDVPAYASAMAADLPFDSDNNGPEPVEMTTFQMSDIVTYVRRPPGIADDRAVYVVYVSGESMFPRYKQGDPVFVDPKRPPAIGDDVIVQLTSNDESEEVAVGLIKTLVKRTSSHLELEQYGPNLRFSVPMNIVAKIHRVIPWAECFGI